MTNLEINIPFNGFYETIHDYSIGDTLEQMFLNHKTDQETNWGIVNSILCKYSFATYRKEYSKNYVSNLAHEFDLPSLLFTALESPIEYNFKTDRIFATVSINDVFKMRDYIDWKDLTKAVKERFSHRSGFISHYDNDLDNWPKDLTEWDCNQLETLLSVYLDDHNTNGDFDQWAEFEVMDSARGNGYFDQWIEESVIDISRYYKIHEYLEKRQTRYAYKLGNKQMTLHKYIVPITCTITQHIELIAENEDDAIEQAYGMFNPVIEALAKLQESINQSKGKIK